MILKSLTLDQLKFLEFKIKQKTRIDEITKCWLFEGALKNGYGIIIYNYYVYYIHRISAALYLNFDLENELIQINHKDELCSNRNCWNYEHIYIGSQHENVLDSITKGTHYNKGIHNLLKTHCKSGHEYNEDNTYNDKKGSRRCRKCHAERTKIRGQINREIYGGWWK